jgi:hypothetical protein
VRLECGRVSALPYSLLIINLSPLKSQLLNR